MLDGEIRLKGFDPIRIREGWAGQQARQSIPQYLALVAGYVMSNEFRAAEIESVVMGLARSMAEHAPLSLAGIKAGLLRAVSLREQVEHGDIDELARQAHLSADAAEGRKAMLEKRRPVFRGE